MRIVAILPVLALLACTSSGGATSDVRIKVRLENQDSHLYDVASVDLDLKRENVVIRERLAAATGHVLDFPAEQIVKVPIGPGALMVTATPRGQDGQPLGGGEGAVTASAEAIATVTVPLLSDRNRPTRGRMSGADGGLEADAGAPDAALAPDAAPEPDGPEADGPPVACSPKSRRLPAVAVKSVDYGSLPRDREDDRVSISSGFAHDHIHAFVGWMRFDLTEIPDGARLEGARLSLVLERITGTPDLIVLYSATDGWDPAQLTSDNAEQVERTDQVSEPLGAPKPSRALYPLNAGRYRPFFAGDLKDNAVTLGMFSATPPTEPEAWGDFYGLDPQQLAPVLEVDTCE
jgi:hypothetical protein